MKPFQGNDVPILQSKLDSFGAFLSFMCAIHCILLPGLAVILPSLALDSLISEPIHNGMLIGAVITALISYTWGFRRHKKLSPFVLFGAGAGLIGANFFVHLPHHEATIAAGGLILVFGHLTNQFFCRSCAKCQK